MSKHTGKAETNNVDQSLSALLDRYVMACQQTFGRLPVQPFDEQWRSPCEAGPPDTHGLIQWQPVRRKTPANFTDLENAIEFPIHPDVKAFYGNYWCDSFYGKTEEGGVTLIQIWNELDFDRLGENIIGHVLAKRRARGDPTIFIACTDEDDLMLSVHMATGRVMLEPPGRPPLREVATSLSELLDRTSPVVCASPRD